MKTQLHSIIKSLVVYFKNSADTAFICYQQRFRLAQRDNTKSNQMKASRCFNNFRETDFAIIVCLTKFCGFYLFCLKKFTFNKILHDDITYKKNCYRKIILAEKCVFKKKEIRKISVRNGVGLLSVFPRITFFLWSNALIIIFGSLFNFLTLVLPYATLIKTNL